MNKTNNQYFKVISNIKKHISYAFKLYISFRKEPDPNQL